MMRKAVSFFLIFIFLVEFSLAVVWSPQGNVDLKNRYSIVNWPVSACASGYAVNGYNANGSFSCVILTGIVYTNSTGILFNGSQFSVTLSPFTTSNLTEGSNLYYTPARVVSAVGNWSSDKSSYATNAALSSVGNWTADKSSYDTTTTVNAKISSIGNWTADKSSYSTTTQGDARYGTSNLTVATVASGFVNRTNWTTIDNYPSACAVGNYVTTIGDTLTCAVPTGTNNGITLDAANITSGTFAIARLPSLNNALTIDAANLTSGTIVNARYNATYFSNLYAPLSGFAAENLTSGTVALARLPALGNQHTHDAANLTSGTIVNARYNITYFDTLYTSPSFVATNFVNRSLWTTIDNYPAACGAGTYVTTIGDTLTCATPVGTTYTAGAGLTLSSTTFSANNQGITLDAANITSGTLLVARGGTGASTLNDLIALGTMTTGNYVSNVSSPNSYIAIGGSVGEGWTPTVTFSEATLNSTIAAKIAATTATYTANNTASVVGTLAGTTANTQTAGDSLYQNLTETVVGGMDYRINFTSVTSFNGVALLQRYYGGSGYQIQMMLYNYNTSAWDTIDTFTDEGAYISSMHAIFTGTNYVSGGVVQLRFYHAAPGVVTYYLSVDYVALTYVSGAVSSGLSGSGTVNKIPLWEDSTSLQDSPLTVSTNNVSLSGNVTAQNFFGKLDASYVQSGTLPDARIANATNYAKVGATGVCTYGIANASLLYASTTAVTCAAQQGTVTSITAGSGLSGGVITGSGTISANNKGITLDAANITSGSLSSARIAANTVTINADNVTAGVFGGDHLVGTNLSLTSLNVTGSAGINVSASGACIAVGGFRLCANATNGCWVGAGVANPCT